MGSNRRIAGIDPKRRIVAGFKEGEIECCGADKRAAGSRLFRQHKVHRQHQRHRGQQ